MGEEGPRYLEFPHNGF